MAANEFAPVTPGEMLKEEFLAEYGLSQNQLAQAIGISPNRIAEIVNNRRRITADTALRLGLYFGNSPEFWLNAQRAVDLWEAAKTAGSKIEKISPLRAA
jgi:addiction module HigA family antidote